MLADVDVFCGFQQATLGKFDTIGSSLLQHGNHLLGIQRLPQTPVEGDQKFIFDPKFKDAKNCSELKKTKAALYNNQAWLKTASKLPKDQKLNGIFNGAGHSATKSPLVTKTHNTNTSSKSSTISHLKSPTLKETTSSKSAETKKTLSHLKSPTVKETTPSKSAEIKKTSSHLKSPILNETTPSKAVETKKMLSHLKSPTLKDTSPSKSTEMKKAEVKPVVNGAFKSHQSDGKEKGAVKIKGQKDCKSHSERENGESCKEQTMKVISSNKSKPPKLSMPER